MTLNESDVASLRYIIYRIRTEATKKTPSRYTTINLCERANLVLKKATRREQRPGRLKFEIGDLD